jgi:hypothetical protein
MVLLTMTNAVVEAIAYCNARNITGWPPTCVEGDPELQSPAAGHPITHHQVITLANCIKSSTFGERASSNMQLPASRLEDLLRNSTVYWEPKSPTPKPVSPVIAKHLVIAAHNSQQTIEYSELMARLREEEETRVYRGMLLHTSSGHGNGERSMMQPSSLPESRHPDDEDEVTYADVSRQMALIINVLLSIVACSVAIWVATSRFSTAKRLALSMGGSGIVGMAEIVVYAGYLRRVKEAKVREQMKPEIKEVMDTWVIENSEPDAEKTLRARSISQAKSLTRRKQYPASGAKT